MSQNTRLLIWNVLHQWTWQYPRLQVIPLHFMVEPSASSLSCQHNHKESTFVSIETSVVWLKAIISCKTTQYLCIKLCDGILPCCYVHWTTHWPRQFVLNLKQFVIQWTLISCCRSSIISVKKYFPKSAMRKAKPSLSHRTFKWKQPATISPVPLRVGCGIVTWELLNWSVKVKQTENHKKGSSARLYVFF